MEEAPDADGIGGLSFIEFYSSIFLPRLFRWQGRTGLHLVIKVFRVLERKEENDRKDKRYDKADDGYKRNDNGNVSDRVEDGQIDPAGAQALAFEGGAVLRLGILYPHYDVIGDVERNDCSYDCDEISQKTQRRGNPDQIHRVQDTRVNGHSHGIRPYFIKQRAFLRHFGKAAEHNEIADKIGNQPDFGIAQIEIEIQKNKQKAG
ncbi:hypothetical protein SDC9_51625 [bioreactor metagenome]|uniref:Uncharacterized protein n=1 Tax=bioreactor metagenome TaxID=1076179 RepID=A0A644WNW3_9ZZZZ